MSEIPITPGFTPPEAVHTPTRRWSVVRTYPNGHEVETIVIAPRSRVAEVVESQDLEAQRLYGHEIPKVEFWLAPPEEDVEHES